MIETKTSAQVNEFAIVENIFGSHLKAVAKAEDKKHFAIMEGNEILTPFELESHGIAFNGVVLLKAGDKMGMLAFNLGNIYIAPEYDYINEAAVGDDFVFEKDGKKGRVTLQGQFISDDEFEQLPQDKKDEWEDIGFIFANDID